jgi:uncharacterized protein
MRSLLVFVFALSSIVSFAQENNPLIHSGNAIERGKELYDSGKFDLAIKQYLTVPDRDTNFVYMQTELAMAYMANKQYELALSTCEAGLKNKTYYRPHFLKTQAITHDRMGKIDESIKLFQSAIKEYPADFGLMYNLGITYFNHNQPEKASECFFNTLSLNPFHSGSHLNLGRLAAFQGRKTQAALAFGMYLSIANNDNDRLVFLNNVLSNQLTEESSIPTFGANAFDKMDQIFKSMIAMEKNFKTVTPFNFAVSRQFEAFFGQLNSMSSSVDDPYFNLYIPVYKKIQSENVMEPFIYHILTSVSNDQVKKWLSKNEKQLKVFYTVVNSSLKEVRNTIDWTPFGGTGRGMAWYDNGNRLDAIGEEVNEVRKGPWKYFYDNGQLSAEGSYNNEGKKIGLWKYYFSTGILKSSEDYKTGETFVYNSDGIKHQHFFLKDDRIDGLVELFYPTGALEEKLIYKDGKRNGPGTSYFYNGKVKSTFTYSEKGLEKEFVDYYENGAIQRKANYVEGVANGDFKEYHINGKTQTQGQHQNGKVTGEWKYFYSNGALQRRGNYQDGLATGEWSYFNKRRELIEKRNFSKGLLNADNTFYRNGKVSSIQSYKNDKLIKVVMYDSLGKVIGSAGNASGNFKLKTLFSSGLTQAEGEMKDGQNHGEWTYYNRYGRVVNKLKYVNGLLQGNAVEYFPTGETKYTYSFKDNERDGYFKEFYQNGKLKLEGWYLSGSVEQRWLSYFADGKFESDHYYLFGKLDGYGIYNGTNGQKSSVAQYKNGDLTDYETFTASGSKNSVRKDSAGFVVIETRYDNKRLQSKVFLQNGDYTRYIKKWYPDGKPFYAYTFLGSRKHGAYAQYEINGQLTLKGQFQYGTENGPWVTYYDNGVKSKEGYYLDGNYDSLWTYYYRNGKISSQSTYLNDEREGVSNYFSPEGTLIVQKYFEEGNLLAYKTLNSGKWSAWTPLAANAKILATFQDGTPAYEEQFANFVRDGHFRIYYASGKVYSDYLYKNGNYDGAYSILYPNGKPLETGKYVNDMRDGLVTIYNEDGSMRMTSEYKMDLRHGKATYFKNGVKVKEFVYEDGMTQK